MEGFFQVLLNILAIVGVVVLAALIIYFLAILVLSVMNKGNNKSEGGKNTNYGRPKVLESNDLGDDFTWEDVQGGRWDDSKKEVKNEKENQTQNAALVETKSNFVEDDVDSLDIERRRRIEEKRNMEQDFDDFDSIFNDDDEVKEEEPVEETNEDELNKLIDIINAESVAQFKTESEKVKEVKAEKVEDATVNVFDDADIEEIEDVVEEEEEVVPKTDDELLREREELERQKAELEEQRKALAEERRKFEEYKQETASIEQQSANTGSMYDNWDANALYQRLEVLRERLKVNEKDLKANRKEYKPLEKVKRLLDKDKEKLRRKEAIVARKKVILYGVNNYVDIDEEKAKKLSEDLDLLDALRMSVQHCEEVMKENKDRFPILEKTNKILTLNNQNIKDDIAEIEAAIAKLNETNTDAEN